MDENQKFYSATQKPDGTYVISKSAQPTRLTYNPANVVKIAFELATNKKYNSLARSISYPLEFIKDGAAILREIYFGGKGTEAYCWVKIMNWTGLYHELLYDGRIDFNAKTEDPKSGRFTVPIVDNSVWSYVSRNDSVQYAIECNETNPDAIRVLFDGINLKARYVFQTVRSDYNITEGISFPSPGVTSGVSYYLPIVEINKEGDAVGIITKNVDFGKPSDDTQLSNWFLSNNVPMKELSISGSFSFIWTTPSSGHSPDYIRVHLREQPGGVYFPDGLDKAQMIEEGKEYSFPLSVDVASKSTSRKFFLYLDIKCQCSVDDPLILTIIPSNIYITVNTRPEAKIIYAIRPLDLIKQLVSKATDNKFPIHSSFFEVNNKQVVTCGDAIRGFDDAKIYTSIEDFFRTYNSLFYMAFRSVDGVLEMEKTTEVYKQDSTIIELGEVIDLHLNTAEEYMVNEVQVGSPKVDLRHPSGRLEFNSTNTFSLQIKNSDGQYNIVTKYRTGCYDMTFLLLDYIQGSTKDNSGDKSCYVLDITDTVSNAKEVVENFEEFTVNNAPLAPYIYSPSSNDIITNARPTIKGTAPAGATVNVYADGAFDGTTTADVLNKYQYTLVNPLSSYEPDVATGEHLLQVTFTDLAAVTSNVNVIIDTTISSNTSIIYPANGDTLYNTEPLIKGVAQTGTLVNVMLNGTLLASVLADGSCKWEFKCPVLANGRYTLNADGDLAIFDIDNNVLYPLITYIGQEVNSTLPIVDNTPLVKGVALPGTQVKLYLNYDSNSIGTATADAAGNWTFQTIPFSYGTPPIFIVPIRNGDNILSTDMSIQTVNIGITGYLLNRPAYSVITGVDDNTVFNVELSPQRMLENHYPYLSSVMDRLRNLSIEFQTADKNANLATILNGKAVVERADVPASSLGNPLFRLERARVKTPTKISFDKALATFNNGGLIHATFRGTELYFLPIGNMKMETITSAVQEWDLLFSPLTPYSSLINLHKDGTTINIMVNSIFHSDYNSLHFVTYNFKDVPSYNFKTIYDDWFDNRNDAWVQNPNYFQKFQKTEKIRDQIISNGVGNIELLVYTCDAVLIDTIPYTVIPNIISHPNVLLEVQVDLTNYQEGQYFFVMQADGVMCAISERIHVKQKWANTILVESANSVNKTTFFYSTGIRTVLRFEGLVKKLQPNIFTDISVDESGDGTLLYSTSNKKRTIRFGTAYGLPDYLYIKAGLAIINDNWSCEGVKYTLEDGAKIEAATETDGHPLYYYNVNVTVSVNPNGKTFTAPFTRLANESVVVVLDAEAMGIPVPSLSDIGLKNE
jgi:hypothetical protein